MKWRLVLIEAAAALSLTAGAAPAAKSVSDVFRVQSATDAGERLVTFDPKRFVRREGDPPRRLRLNLAPNLAMDAVIERTRFDGWLKFVSRGRLSAGGGRFTIVVDGATAAALIDVPGVARYRLEPTGRGRLHRLRRVDPQQLPSCRPGPAPPSFASAAPATATFDTGATIDVMIVYTPQARAAAGGTAGIEALAELSVELTNDAYELSLVAPRVRLVHTAEIPYFESGDALTELIRLTEPADGYMDEVHALRNQYGADLVSLFVEEFEACGVAWRMVELSTGFSEYAFSTCHMGCAADNLTFPHEIGHNMGLGHDWVSDPHVFNYSFGYDFTGGSGAAFRTIMSAGGGTRILRHSNPSLKFDGVPFGVPATEPMPADAVRSLNTTAVTVANFRASVVGGPNCAHDVDGDGDGDLADAMLMLSNMGECDGCPEDVNGDGSVNFRDLLILLMNLGPCVSTNSLEPIPAGR